MNWLESIISLLSFAPCRLGVAFITFLSLPLFAAPIPAKVVICGIARNVEKAAPNTIASIEKLGAAFEDYHAIIYENNSNDKTKEIFQALAQKNPKVTFLSERISKRKLAKEMEMGKVTRYEALARARNKVLELALSSKFDTFTYVIWADLDFTDPWDVEHITESITHPEHEWDAIFANGSYDRLAWRDAECPIGRELVGNKHGENLDLICTQLTLSPEKGWRAVYSAFGGLGIYKREALQGCRYSGVVTKELEGQVKLWLEAARLKKDVPLLKEYETLLSQCPTLTLTTKTVPTLDRQVGIRLKNHLGLGEVVWFSASEKTPLPSVCEHIALHAAMAAKGRAKLFINPKIVSDHP